MHELRDENGNLIPHGGHDHHDHDHHHEDHCHEHCGACGSEEQKKCRDEKLALLTYMVQHNTAHAAETSQMADQLEAAGMADVAKQIREGVAAYDKGNMYLSLALSLYKEHLAGQEAKEE